jgi:hypothetical protein
LNVAGRFWVRCQDIVDSFCARTSLTGLHGRCRGRSAVR